VTAGANIAGARLSVLLDVRHPFAYLALHPTVALAESLAVAVNWLPTSVPALRRPSEPGEADARGIRHRRHRAQAIAREIETYSAAQGLVVREYYRSGSSAAATLGWLWTRDRNPDRLPSYLAELFRSYWAVELDPADLEDVAALVEAPVAFRRWCANGGPTTASAIEDELQERGLFGTPAFLVEDEVFYGRQHLPMIRWILEGRSGAVPI
jgi:2-hydroxychromene-2-carboxylate isomerase